MSKIVEILKQIEADGIVFVMKLHNYHWNVKGMDFHPTHAATQRMYETFSELYDDIAERILQLGAKPIATLKDVLATARIQEESASSFNSKQIVQAVLKDYSVFEENFKKLSEAANDAKDSVTASLADEQLASIQKNIWMFKAQLES